MAKRRNPFLGMWRITVTALWTRDDLDEVAPAHIIFRASGQGELQLIAIEADLDYRLGKRDGTPAVEFSWQGSDDGQPISGRGWARPENGEIVGRLFIHQGDETTFTARPDSFPTSRSSGRASRAAYRAR